MNVYTVDCLVLYPLILLVYTQGDRKVEIDSERQDVESRLKYRDRSPERVRRTSKESEQRPLKRVMVEYTNSREREREVTEAYKIELRNRFSPLPSIKNDKTVKAAETSAKNGPQEQDTETSYSEFFRIKTMKH